MLLSEHLPPSAILCGCQISTRDEILDLLVASAAVAYGWDDGPAIAAMVRDRESKMSTAIGLGIAVPHSRKERLEQVSLAVACVPAGLEFTAPDRKPVRLVVLLVSPITAPGLHVQALSMVSRLNKDLVDRLVGAPTPTEFLRILAGWEAQLPKK